MHAYTNTCVCVHTDIYTCIHLQCICIHTVVSTHALDIRRGWQDRLQYRHGDQVVAQSTHTSHWIFARVKDR